LVCRENAESQPNQLELGGTVLNITLFDNAGKFVKKHWKLTEP